MKTVVAGEEMNIDVPGASSFKIHSDLKKYGSSSTQFSVEEASPSAPAFAPEGRVHGGSLMAMLTDGLTLGPGSINSLSCDPSDTEKSKYLMMSQSWL